MRRGARLAWRAFQRFQHHNGPDQAAAVSYYTLLSLVPLLIFLASVGVRVLGSFDAAYQGTLLLMRGIVVPLGPAGLAALREFAEQSRTFQWPGLLLLAWTSRRAIASLFSALERIFGAPGRGFASHNLVALSMVLVSGLALLVTMALTTLVSAVRGLLLRLGAWGALDALGAVLLFHLLPVALGFMFFFLVYRVGPHRMVTTRRALIGAALATVLWETAKAGFAYYIKNTARYASLYGALEGVIVLALWLEISASIVLYCAEVVALLGRGDVRGENSTKEGTSEGTSSV